MMAGEERMVVELERAGRTEVEEGRMEVEKGRVEVRVRVEVRAVWGEAEVARGQMEKGAGGLVKEGRQGSPWKARRAGRRWR